MRILEISTDEYPLVMQPLIKAKDYMKDPEVGKMLAETIQILQRASKRQQGVPSVPSGGSYYCSCFSCKGTKIKSLMHMFGL